jgi:quercetin dioxygenase-like cupin family protein
MTGWQVEKIDAIPRAGKRWIPIRNHFGGRAFGVNAWVADGEGEDVIGEHTEEGTGHEELYLVVSGHATFTLDGEEVDAPAGTLVYLARTETKRKAVAREAGTTILSIGAKAGEAYEVQPWEVNAEMFPLYQAGDYEGAAALLRDAVEREPDPGTYYNLACMEALAGHTEAAFEALTHIASEPRLREAAAGDSDLDSLRDDPRFTTLLETS